MSQRNLEKYLREHPVFGPEVYLPHFGVWALKNRRGETDLVLTLTLPD